MSQPAKKKISVVFRSGRMRGPLPTPLQKLKLLSSSALPNTAGITVVKLSVASRL